MSLGKNYRYVTTEVCQGDIFEIVPHLHLKPPLRVIREANVASKNRRIWGLYTWPPEEGHSPSLPKSGVSGGGFHVTEGEEVAVFCQISRGIILNHDCDIENEKSHHLVAIIHPLTRVTEEEHREIIRQNKNYARYYLPPAEGCLDESYVDFRRLTCIHPSFLDPKNRIVGLTEIHMKALFRQFVLFLTHFRINEDAISITPVE